MSSTRLAGKVLADLAGEPMLLRQIERIRRAQSLDAIVVATSTDPADDLIAELCERAQIDCARGPLDDVLERFLRASIPFDPKWVVRLTGDCPLADPEVIDAVVQFAIDHDFDYATNALEPTFPDGLDVEVVRMTTLVEAGALASLTSEREHVTPYIHKRPDRFKIGHYSRDPDLSALRWTVDEPEDLAFVREVYEALYPVKPMFGTQDVLDLLERRPELMDTSARFERNEGYAKSLEEDEMELSQSNSPSRHSKSEQLLERAERTIPLGSQTFSKSRTQYPFGVSPYFIQKAKGSKVWDVDGNEYVDFISSLCSVTLGYNDPDVTAAVQSQLEDGVIFSLPHPIEMEVSERIVAMVPCAEKVRFGKNGSDATAGAVRVARAFTGRDRIAVCGYHGWQDWYIGSTARHLGVPQATRDLTHTFTFNDPESLHQLFKSFPGEIAAVVLEPMNVTYPTGQFLEKVKELTHANGAVLVFDETITGFRFANGGAQELFGVVPDLATFGKGLANGYPVSAVAGRADIMKLMEEIFFSFTFGGETLSLAAAKATLDKLEQKPVVATIRQTGQSLMDIVTGLIEKHSLGHCLSMSGDPSWSFLNFQGAGRYSLWELKTLFMQEVFERGVLAYGTHNISYAHSLEDLAKLEAAYDQTFEIISDAIENERLTEYLRCKPLEPLFKVR